MGKSRKITNFFALVAAAAMLVTSVPVMGAGQESAETTQASPWESSWQEGDAYSADGDAYQIYPIPQSIEYTEGAAFYSARKCRCCGGKRNRSGCTGLSR